MDFEHIGQMSDEQIVNVHIDMLFDVPIYKHDCDECTFLETIRADLERLGDGKRGRADLYIHKNESDPDHHSVIIRLSDEGADYISFPICTVIYSTDPVWGQVRMILLKEGYIKII